MVGYETGISDVQIHKLALSTTLGAFEKFILFGGVAFDSCALTSVKLGDKMESIGYGAFVSCSQLETVELGNSLTSIGNSAFSDCSKLTSIIIPKSVESIQWDAFYGCTKLTIYCEAAEKPSGWDSNWNSMGCPVVWWYGASKPAFPGPETYERLSDGTINFGAYPQSKVTDTTLTTALTAAAGALPTASNSQAWTSYKYYIENTNTTDYMWYQDVAYNNNWYRGVYFTSYRPSGASIGSNTGNTYQDDSGYIVNNVYWFAYEVLNWTVLEEKDGTAFLLCNSIVDSQEYYDKYNSRTINGATVYANNYAESNIRKWLNETFYETAFTSLQQSLIQITEVDNSAKATNPYGNSTQWNSGVNEYACENTNDKIFLLSEEEVTNTNYGFASHSTYDEARYRKPSDYAQSQGLYTSSSYYGNGSWWLRSSSYKLDYYARAIGYEGYADYHATGESNLGVVPALKITL